MPVAPAADLRKAQAASRRRQKEAYSLLTMTMELKTQVDYLRQNHFQQGRAAYLYMQGAMASIHGCGDASLALEVLAESGTAGFSPTPSRAVRARGGRGRFAG